MSREYRYCGTCSYWHPDNLTVVGAEATGQCRRYAPATIAGWPAVGEADWCGEFDASGMADVPFDEGPNEATVEPRRRNWR